MSFTDAEWVGLALVTESNQQHEWRYVASVMRRRLESNVYPNTYAEVITQPYQFSHFNKYLHYHDIDVMFAEVLRDLRTDISAAKDCAAWVIDAPEWQLPFGPRVLHYFSPVSMVPKFSAPSWAGGMRQFTPSGVNPDRFVFCES